MDEISSFWVFFNFGVMLSDIWLVTCTYCRYKCNMQQPQTPLIPHCTIPQMTAFLFRYLPYKETFHI